MSLNQLNLHNLIMQYLYVKLKMKHRFSFALGIK